MKLLLFGSHFQTLFAEYLVPTYSIRIYTLERLGVRQVFNIATLTARCVQVYIYTHMIDHVCAEINSRRKTKQFTHATGSETYNMLFVLRICFNQHIRCFTVQVWLG